MNDRIRARLEELQREYASRKDALAELQRQEQELQAILQRLAGSIQLHQELLDSPTE